MTHPWRRSAALTIAIAGVSITAILSAQTQSASRRIGSAAAARPAVATEVKPDLNGIWNFATLTPLERPAEFAGKEFLSEAEAVAWQKQLLTRNNADAREGTSGTTADVDRAYNDVWWDRGTTVVGTRRTSLIVEPKDGKIPPLTQEGKRRFEAYGGFTGRGGSDSWEDRSLWERCITNNAMPRLQTGYNMNMQIFQSGEYVTILYEMIHEARIIPLDGRPHLSSGVRQILGDSRGRWDGNTLVVDVTNFTDKTNFRGSTDTLHLIERFTPIDRDTLLYQFTIDDPKTFVSSWSGELPMTRTRGPVYEYACHEGNYGLAGILSGARAKEKADAQTAQDKDVKR
jgi:hypothetical protein